jgi:IS5 family transposase
MAKEGLAVGMQSVPGLRSTKTRSPEQFEILTETTPSIVLADRGYHGVKLEGDRTRLILSHTRKLAPALKRLLKLRQVVELTIGHNKADGQHDRNCFKDELSAALHAVMCGAGHKLRMILTRLRALSYLYIAVQAIRHHEQHPYERDEAEMTTTYC